MVYALGRERTDSPDDDVMTVAFCFEQQAVTGYCRAGQLDPISEEGTAAYLSQQAEFISGPDGARLLEVAFEGAMLMALGEPMLIGNEDFEIDENGVLTKYVGAGGDVVVPDEVTSIGDKAFMSCRGLASVSLPSELTAIGSEAFYGCTNLVHVEIPGKVKTIGERAFSVCSSLREISLPSSVVEIGEGCFSNCYNLSNVVLPGQLATIGDSLFSNCTGLKEISIPESVHRIGNTAFSGCSNLYSVSIPSNVSEIGSLAFNGCTVLTKVKIFDVLASIGDAAFNSDNNASFEIYVRNMEDVCPAEQYAIDHDIPYTKVLYGQEAGDAKILSVEGPKWLPDNLGIGSSWSGDGYRVEFYYLCTVTSEGADEIGVYMDGEDPEQPNDYDDYRVEIADPTVSKRIVKATNDFTEIEFSVQQIKNPAPVKLQFAARKAGGEWSSLSAPVYIEENTSPWFDLYEVGSDVFKSPTAQRGSVSVGKSGTVVCVARNVDSLTFKQERTDSANPYSYETTVTDYVEDQDGNREFTYTTKPDNSPGSFNITITAAGTDKTESFPVDVADGEEPQVVISGFFDSESYAMKVGETLDVTASANVTNANLTRVTINVEGYTETDRLVSKEISGKSWRGTMTLDGTAAPFNAPGTYTLKLYVGADAGNPNWAEVDRATLVVSEADAPQVVISGSFDSESYAMKVGETLDVTANANVTNANLVQVTVNVDEYPENSQLVSKTISGKSWRGILTLDGTAAPFNAPGTYTLKLFVRADAGNPNWAEVDRATLVVTEEVVPQITAVELSKAEIDPGEIVTVKVTGNDALAGVQMKIAKPDGSVLKEQSLSGLTFEITCFDASVAPGVYTASFTAVGKDGAAGNTMTKTIVVRGEDVSAPAVTGFTMSPSEIYVGQKVRFTVQAPGATKVQLLVDGKYWDGDTYDVQNGIVAFARAFTSPIEKRMIQFRASADGQTWGELCAAQYLTVKTCDHKAHRDKDWTLKSTGIQYTEITNKTHTAISIKYYDIKCSICGQEVKNYAEQGAPSQPQNHTAITPAQRTEKGKKKYTDNGDGTTHHVIVYDTYSAVCICGTTFTWEKKVEEFNEKHTDVETCEKCGFTKKTPAELFEDEKERVRKEIEDTYAAITKKDRPQGYGGYGGGFFCGRFVGMQALEMGFDYKNAKGENHTIIGYPDGRDWYSVLGEGIEVTNTKNGKTYVQKKYPGDTCLYDILEANNYENVYNIIMSFSKKPGGTTSDAGHVRYIYAILKNPSTGKFEVLFADNMTITKSKEHEVCREGTMVSLELERFMKLCEKYVINGAIHFCPNE